MEEKLTVDEQLELFSDEFGAQVLLKEFLASGAEFCEEAQLKMLNMEPPFNVDNTLLYLSEGHQLCEKAEVKLFDLPENVMVLSYYCFVKKHSLKPLAQARLLEMADIIPGFFKQYVTTKKMDPSLGKELAKKAKELGFAA